MAFRWHELQVQIRYAYERSGLCQRQFREAKITPDDIKTWEDFTYRVPFTTKQDLLADQQANPPFGTRLAIREDDIYAIYLTSGTSGKGQEVHADTKADQDLLLDAISIFYYWMGCQKGDKVMNPLPLGMTVAAPSHLLGLRNLGCHVFNLGMYDTKTKLEYIRRFKLTCLYCTPAYLETLTAEAEQMGLSPARDFSVERILTAIQAYPVSFVRKMEEKWEAKISDYYASTQRAVGCTCEKGAVTGEQRGHYHLLGHALTWK